jgi:hypothetical protein
MTKDRFILWLNLGLVVFVLITAALLYIFILKGKPDASHNFTTLEILDAASGKVFGSWSVDNGNEFSIEFIHSVNQSPVLETFKIEGGQIRTLSVKFYSFGAGMQTDLEEGQTMIHDGDTLIITGFTSISAGLNYIVGTVSDHLLYINGETVSLRELCGKNAHIRIQIK